MAQDGTLPLCNCTVHVEVLAADQQQAAKTARQVLDPLKCHEPGVRGFAYLPATMSVAATGEYADDATADETLESWVVSVDGVEFGQVLAGARVSIEYYSA